MSGEEIRFNFDKYDVGGKGAKAGDGKLTGEEVQKAKADGWNIWDGMPKAGKENQEPPRLNTQQPLLAFKKMPPVKMPTIPDKSNDFSFSSNNDNYYVNKSQMSFSQKKANKDLGKNDYSHNFFEKTHQIDKSNDKAFDITNSLSSEYLNEQLSKISGKQLMEDFQNKYGK